MIRRRLLEILLLLVITPALRAEETEFNTLLFRTTFKIEGPGASPGSLSLGTVFLMAKPIPNTTRFRSVMITARHVLDSIHGDTATLNLRRRTESGWRRARFPIKIRDSGQPLWTELEDVDVDVMYLNLPQGIKIPIISTTLLYTVEL